MAGQGSGWEGGLLLAGDEAGGGGGGGGGRGEGGGRGRAQQHRQEGGGAGTVQGWMQAVRGTWIEAIERSEGRNNIKGVLARRAIQALCLQQSLALQ